jgi:hypothetical protein
MTLKNPPGSVPNIGRIIAQARELKNPWPIFDAYQSPDRGAVGF